MKYRFRHQVGSQRASLYPVCAAALMVVAALFTLGCERSAPGPEVVANSDLGQLTRAELDAYIMVQPEGKRKPLPRQEPQDWRREMVQNLLAAQALEAEARSSGLAETHDASGTSGRTARHGPRRDGGVTVDPAARRYHR